VCAPRRRIGGIDAARALAVTGMVMVHFGPTGDDAEGVGGALYTLPHGRASILFVVVAGMGVTLLADSGGHRPLWLRIGLRVLLLAPLGLALQLLDHGVLVILQYYAVYFVIAAAATRLGDRALVATAVAALILGPVAYLGAWQAWPDWFGDEIITLEDPIGVIVVGVLLSGAYPALTWTGPLLVGVWLGRRPLRDPAVLGRLLLAGVATAIAAAAVARALVAWVGDPAEPSWWLLAVDEPHSQMPLWLLGATGAAAAAVVASIWLVDRAPRVTWPAVATGQLALTIYVAHLLVLSAWPDLLQRATAGAAALSVARFTAVAVIAATLWRAVLPYGPLELAFRLPLRRGR
jgi:hypothetical protein